MAMENLPRPWLLAALTGLRVAEMLDPDDRTSGEPPVRRSLSRPEPRRRRLREARAPGRRAELMPEGLN